MIRAIQCRKLRWMALFNWKSLGHLSGNFRNLQNQAQEEFWEKEDFMEHIRHGIKRIGTSILLLLLTLIMLPAGSAQAATKIKGIDVSRWQGKVDWKKVKASGVEFVMLGIGRYHNGVRVPDTEFTYNITNALANGIHVGVYLYSEAGDVKTAKKEAQFMRATARATREIQSGESVHMNGAQALVYCRIRKLDSDFMRTHRQRKVITALIKKAKTASPLTLKKLADKVLPMVQTDISPMELTKLVFGAPKYIGYDIKSERVPHENTWSSQTKKGQSVIVTDFDANIQFLKTYLYSTDPVEEDETAS